MKILAAVPSPRDLAQFDAAFQKINVDKLIVKYMPEQEAYNIIRERFLKYTEYTHLAIVPDDLIVEPQHWDQLVADLKEYDYPVACGVCNLDNSPEHQGMLNICINHPPAISRVQTMRSYKWLFEGSEEHQQYLNKTPPIVKVNFAGFPCIIFARDVISLFVFKDDRKPYNPKERGCCVDVMACADLADLDIPIHCDLRVRMTHLKIDDNQIEGKMVGIKEPKIEFIPQSNGTSSTVALMPGHE